MRQIPTIGEDLGFGVRRHPLGFIAIYLSQQVAGLHTLGRTGTARANFYPPGIKLAEDIHSHGFEFVSGVIGQLLNTRHHPDWDTKLPDGEGLIGYQTYVDAFGRNHTARVTDAVVSVPTSKTETLYTGAIYSLRPKIEFHSVEAGEDGAITVFCKSPGLVGPDGMTLILRRPEEPAPPEVY